MISPAVAIVGMGVWVPGASELGQFWENSLARRRQFREFPDCRMPLADYWQDPTEAAGAVDKTYADRAALLDDFTFDWAKRRIPESTFKSTDTAHWLALEVALKALSDAGYSRQTVPTERSAALIGNSLTGDHTRSWAMRLRWPYVKRSLRAAANARGMPEPLVAELEETMEDYFKSAFREPNEDTLAGVLSNTIAGRICNYLDFRGGGYVVDGACSSGLLAVATAAKALATDEIDFALAGGVDVSLDPMELVGFARLGALTHGDMNVYDERASGFIPGEGCGVVALKRLEDARRDGDYVYATIRGWGISSDGKGGITQPHAGTQAIMLRRAYELAGFEPGSVAFIEGHGTATPVGDPAELCGIQLAVDAEAKPARRAVGVTSLKTLLGHTKAASGVLALIRTAMAVNRRVLPPLAGCDSPSKIFREKATALFPIVQGEQREPGSVLRAGVQAMGFGGINCHAVLESADAPSTKLGTSLDERALMASHQETELFTLAATSVPALISRAREVEALCGGASVAELVDLAAKLSNEVDVAAPVRAALVAGRPGELRDRLRELVRDIENAPPAPGEVRSPTREITISHSVRHRLGYVFPGQGAQQLGMARTIVERCGWARKLVAQADEWLVACGSQPVSGSIWRDVTRARDGDEVAEWNAALSRTEVTQPAIALASLLWVEYLRRLNLTPSLVAGHSLGELVALYAAGAYDARTLIELAAAKGRAMANLSGEPGAMASLGCDYARARKLIAEVGAGLEVANVNAPDQIVVAGTEQAIDEVARHAREQNVACSRLLVSNAFHSSLMERARDQFLADAPLSDEFATLDVPCYSCASGELLTERFDLRTLVADQIVARVNWVDVVNAASEECDYFLEVGPGRVLTGLINATNGPDGTPCLPIASRPDADRDLNIAVAAAFARGAEVDWSSFYADRLVRPFVAAAGKTFIQNPAEAPFAPSRVHPPSSYENGSTANPADVLQEYLERRGQFLIDVVRADIGAEPGARRDAAVPAAPADAPRTPQHGMSESPPVVPDATPAVSGNGRLRTSAAARLIEVLAEKTGYEAASMDQGLRLLDDLNLDSIKAAEVIGGVAEELQADIDPAEIANGTIAEIADAITAVSPSTSGRGAGTGASGSSDVAGLLCDVIAELTGFATESLALDLSLIDDLNLDSIKAAEAVAKVCAGLGVGDDIDPSELTGGTLADIVRTIEKVTASRTSAPPESVTSPAQVDVHSPWVRSFVVDPVVVAVDDESIDDFNGSSVLVVAEESDAELGQALADLFASLGADVASSGFDFVDPVRAEHVVAVLPSARAAEQPADAIFRTVQRLSKVVPPLRSAEAPAGSLTFVQFGGVLSLANERGSFAASSADAFAASVHHERPGMKVRVLDFAPQLAADSVARHVAAELQVATPFSAAGYDAEHVRRAPRARLVEGEDFQLRPVKLDGDDVVVVTGGGKGIMAECALALAATCGATVALVGTTPRNSSDEVGATLRRFAEQGLKARYLQCDVTDLSAVRALLSTVSEEVGPVSAIVHGAGLNRPRRVEQTDAAAAFDEVAPKIAGAINLMRASEEMPIKLFVGVSSIIGVTGMPGNSWYALGNQMLDSVVREFADHRKDCAAASIAYSVWGETGMGARMGSVDQLAKMGVGSIPTADGVRHFLRLISSCPGATQVVVTGRLGGLDTWYRQGRNLPEKARYLERIVRLEPGVELAAETSLSMQRDDYLRDHVWKGTPLFPTVFGLEAMAQAVRCVTGQALDRVRIENVALRRPITVRHEVPTRIRVEAQVCERLADSDEVRVLAAIRTERSHSAPEFSAEFVVLDATGETPRRELPASLARLDIDPVKHLYGGLLFQGPRYQRLRKLHSLDSQHCRFEAELRKVDGEYVLGDPFLLDVLLQSGQLVVPQDICLPFSIGAIDLHPERFAAGVVDGLVYDKVTDGAYVDAKVAAVVDGRVAIQLTDYRSRAIEKRPDNPTAEELANPADRDKRLIDAAAADHGSALGVAVPNVTISHTPGIHEQGRDARHERERPVFQEVIGKVVAQREAE
ncbi:SDR family NAD(P)-dependent oxidoreductase [Saccharopolyspora sp. NPDC050389]|uniref:SDR family NAD(P)-dependent oxidoreductase n=1 Tax=Saccharopolyspora sp. NPDC050389 TaxID=3155516 RepID=UPI0034046EE8